MLLRLRVLTFSAVLFALLAGTRSGNAQNNSGNAEVSFQGYYSVMTGQQLSATSGVGVLFGEFLPNVGVLKGSFQGYAFNNGFRGGENFLEVQGIPILGYHWDLVSGDFRMPTNLVEDPFTNLVTPDLSARGLNFAISRTDRKLSFFFGQSTLQEGPRVPFFVTAPQNVFGAKWEQSFGSRFKFGVRYMHLASGDSAIAGNQLLLSENRLFRSVDSMSVQSSFAIVRHLKLFSEATLSRSVLLQSAPVKSVPLSFVVGPSWDTQKFSLRANYASESASYLPLLGYYAGDRKGPFVEGHYRFRSRLELYASASRYANNLENDPRAPTFNSTSFTYGASANLGWRFSTSAQVSDFRFNVLPYGPSLAQDSRNQQISLNLARPVGRHNLRFTYMDLKSASSLSYQRQPSYEFADNFSWKRFVLGGGLRLQQDGGGQGRSTLFFRGNAQLNLGRLSAYAYFEQGKDFVASSVFTKNAYASNVFGVSAEVRRDWSLQLEGFRDNLTTSLNPASVFVLESQGVAVPAFLSGFNQWSVYVRASHALRWGAPVPANAAGTLDASTLLPLVGSIEGFVTEEWQNQKRPVEGVPISLDGNEIATTDASGAYRFSDVPEGFHVVELAERELPAEFEPGSVSSAKLQIETRRVSRADFQVIPLTSLSGKVLFAPGIPVETVVIRLQPGTRYTTPDSDGSFTFYNLPAGDYDVVVDEKSLPDDALLMTPGTVNVNVQLGQPNPELEFEIGRKKVQEPVRELFERRIILNGPGGSPQQVPATPRGSAPAGSSPNGADTNPSNGR